jgi:hypothetical protein
MYLHSSSDTIAMTATNNPTNSKQRYATMQLLHPYLTPCPACLVQVKADEEG